MTEKAFELGNTVRLKSGGPLMTVDDIQGNDIVCVWFEGKRRFESKFKSHSIEHDDGLPIIG